MWSFSLEGGTIAEYGDRLGTGALKQTHTCVRHLADAAALSLAHLGGEEAVEGMWSPSLARGIEG